MDPKLITRISEQVYKRFPEVKGKKPRVRRQNAAAKSNGQSPTYLLTFKGSGNGPGGVTIPRLVRVVVNEKGNILKMSTSKG